MFSADARSKFDLKDVPSEEIITIFVSEMAVSSMTSSVFFTGSRVEMDVPKARILHTQICKNIPMRAYYFDQKTHRRKTLHDGNMQKGNTHSQPIRSRVAP